MQIMNTLIVLEKDPMVSCVSVHNHMKPDFTADDIIHGVRAC